MLLQRKLARGSERCSSGHRTKDSHHPATQKTSHIPLGFEPFVLKHAFKIQDWILGTAIKKSSGGSLDTDANFILRIWMKGAQHLLDKTLPGKVLSSWYSPDINLWAVFLNKQVRCTLLLLQFFHLVTRTCKTSHFILNPRRKGVWTKQDKSHQNKTTLSPFQELHETELSSSRKHFCILYIHIEKHRVAEERLPSKPDC